MALNKLSGKLGKHFGDKTTGDIAKSWFANAIMLVWTIVGVGGVMRLFKRWIGNNGIILAGCFAPLLCCFFFLFISLVAAKASEPRTWLKAIGSYDCREAGRIYLYKGHAVFDENSFGCASHVLFGKGSKDITNRTPDKEDEFELEESTK